MSLKDCNHLFRCIRCNKRVKEPNSYCKECVKELRNIALGYMPDKTMGQQKYNLKGRPICKLCGRPFYNLQAHITNGHKITMENYCDMFDVELSKTKPRKMLRLSYVPLTKKENKRIEEVKKILSGSVEFKVRKRYDYRYKR